MKTVRQIDELGRLVIPIDFREAYGLKASEEVYLCSRKEGILIYKKEQDDEIEKDDKD